MKSAFLAAMILVGVSSADFVDLGADSIAMNKPFCGDCWQSLRFQMLELDSEIGTAMTIGSISFKRAPLGSDDGYVNLGTFQIYMGLCQSDQLSVTFENNYLPGSRILVYDHDSVTITAGAADEWFEIQFDTPYFYAGHDNLVIELTWDAGSESIFTWGYNAGPARLISGGYGHTTGDAETAISHIRLNGTLDLERATFGGIKVLTGR